ncbi:helix-turn-helix, Psq domain [Halomonas sp. THAF12]|uniref:helix-turn-helix domain-containing protein n=1 Tax=Halomonas sp. THAF12 TaxID=2587849 RepID=UPI0012A87729|nr:helix-turn-helix domain-containing protein [Halomonas sp. THAF12]QFT86566.1 helix-turn-helix, Psq domain [Halomonas sp. THAF12]
MSKHDWEACQRDYRVGQLSIRHLAAKHGIPESTIRSKAKAEGWQRDLTEPVREATRIKLSREPSRSGIAQSEDCDVIEAASDEAVLLLLEHRQAIARWRAISERLANSLAMMPITEENFDRFGRSLNSGLEALAKAIRLERQAYNLNDAPSDELKSFAELMAEVAPEGY